MKKISDQQKVDLSIKLGYFNQLRTSLGLRKIPEPGFDYLIKYYENPNRFSICWDNVWFLDPLIWETSQITMLEIEMKRQRHKYDTSLNFHKMREISEEYREAQDKEGLRSFERGLRIDRLNRLEQLFERFGKTIPDFWIDWFEDRLDSKTCTISNFAKSSKFLECP